MLSLYQSDSLSIPIQQATAVVAGDNLIVPLDFLNFFGVIALKQAEQARLRTVTTHLSPLCLGGLVHTVDWVARHSGQNFLTTGNFFADTLLS